MGELVQDIRNVWKRCVPEIQKQGWGQRTSSGIYVDDAADSALVTTSFLHNNLLDTQQQKVQYNKNIWK